MIYFPMLSKQQEASHSRQSSLIVRKLELKYFVIPPTLENPLSSCLDQQLLGVGEVIAKLIVVVLTQV